MYCKKNLKVFFRATTPDGIKAQYSFQTLKLCREGSHEVKTSLIMRFAVSEQTFTQVSYVKTIIQWEMEALYYTATVRIELPLTTTVELKKALLHVNQCILFANVSCFLLRLMYSYFLLQLEFSVITFLPGHATHKMRGLIARSCFIQVAFSPSITPSAVTESQAIPLFAFSVNTESR